MNDLKHRLYDYCVEYLAKKEADITRVIHEAREASANETKSSAGDKYETAREMAQQEIDMNMARLGEVKAMNAALSRVAKDTASDIVIPGSLIRVSDKRYYITISAGTVKMEDNIFYIVSPSSPIGAALMGKRAGMTFTLNGKTATIDEVS